MSLQARPVDVPPRTSSADGIQREGVPRGNSRAAGAPRVSVILSSYNQVAYLDGAIASVLTQTLDSLELIIVDNGSTDGSHELLRKYTADPRIRLMLHDRNEAVTRRLNGAIASATGDFVSIL